MGKPKSHTSPPKLQKKKNDGDDDVKKNGKEVVKKVGVAGLVGPALVALLSMIAGILTPFLSRTLLAPAQTTTPTIETNFQRNLGSDKIDQKKNDEALKEASSSFATSTSTSSIPNTTPEYTCNQETLSNYLHEIFIPGMHIVCLEENSLVFYRNAKFTDSPTRLPIDDENNPLRNWSDLKETLSLVLRLRPADELHQPWSTFSPTGDRLLSETDSDNESISAFPKLGMFLVFQGGQWIWPGVEKGFRRVIQIDNDEGTATTSATLETLSLQPLLFSVQGFLSDDECDWIQENAAPTMRYSDVTLMDKDQGRPASDFRTSQTTFLMTQANTPVLQAIDKRTASLVRIPRSHQEPAQVLKYGYLEKYDAHHDYFDPKQYQQDKGTLALIENGRRNRMATVFWYLSDVEEGGETAFPIAKLVPPLENVTNACDNGLRVKPVKGRVIIFYSMTPNGDLDPYSSHTACPVKKGVKWAANKWVWNGPLKYM